MPNKDRLLLLLQLLQNKSDDEKWLTTADIRAVLEEEGHECSVRTLRKDVQSLRNCGYVIEIREKEGLSTEYAFQGREWNEPELQILVDAVCAAQFIPEKKSRELVQKLSTMAGPSHTAELRPQILISERIKAKNWNMIYSVDTIRRAIERNKKICFRYLRFNQQKKQVPKHEGTPEEKYIVSPYATVWKDDRYYLVGWSDKRQKVAVFRIDRMKDAKQLPNKRIPQPNDFDIRDYTDKVFRMYDGPVEDVTLKCSTEILDQVIDRFGDGIALENMQTEDFQITVPVSLSTTFYAWVFQFVGKMTIIAPKHVKDVLCQLFAGCDY